MTQLTPLASDATLAADCTADDAFATRAAFVAECAPFAQAFPGCQDELCGPWEPAFRHYCRDCHEDSDRSNATADKSVAVRLSRSAQR